MFRVKLAVHAGLVLSAGALALAGCGPGPGKEPAQPEQAPPKKIKDAKYDSIKIGMSHDEVDKILGTGEEMDPDEARQRFRAVKRPDKDWEPLINSATWVKYDGDKVFYLLGYTENKVAIKDRQEK
jgi:hypothetical protein